MLRSLAVAVALCFVSAGCSTGSDAVEGLDEIGTTSAGATLYAAIEGGEWLNVGVLVDGDPWCRSRGPSGLEPQPVAACNDSSDDGSVYVTQVAKGDATPRLCDHTSGADAEVERIASPDSWDFDFVVGTTPQQGVFLAPCSAVGGR